MHSAPTSRSGGGIVSVLAVAGIVGSLMQTLVVPLVGELPRLLDADAADTSWVITVTLLVGAVATPVVGKLGDLYGKRRMMLACSVPLVAGSVVCALAGSLLPMIAGRGLQGLGVGMIPLGVSALRDLLPPQRVGPAIALMSSSMGIGGALGLPISAAVAEYADWRMLFWGAAALSVLVAVLIWLLVPATPAHGRGRLDVAGAAGLGVALVCLLLGVSKGAEWGWGSGTTLGLLGTAVVVALLWGMWELRVRDPLVDLRTTARPQVLLTNVASVLIGFAMYAQSLVVIQVLQLPAETGYGLGQSMLAAGLWLAPSGLMMMAVSSLGARLSAARGPRTSLFVGALIIAMGYGAAVGLMGWAWGLMVAGSVGSIGVGLAYGAMPALIMGAVPQSETASANSFNTLMRSIGTSVSAAVVGVILSQLTVSMGGHVLPSEWGFRTVLLVGCGVALVAALVTLTLPRPRPATAPASSPAAPASSPAGAAPLPAGGVSSSSGAVSPPSLAVSPASPAASTAHPAGAVGAAAPASDAPARPPAEPPVTTATQAWPPAPVRIGHEELGPWRDAFRPSAPARTSHAEHEPPRSPTTNQPPDATAPAREDAEHLGSPGTTAETTVPRARLAPLSMENAELRADNTALREENLELRADNTALREENLELRTENEALRKELDVLMQGVSSWVQNLADRAG
ncbi:MFS transporter [Nonomuraea gerenzanensis]|uniref:Membrane transport protein n=1 Tax=Nonomuraea gerenzanensis TaxID=93944 RepID=A0A1M4EFT1_9ACTN|nr:MFS transporter [Nonomuraea gerenzanensis]SBO97644.1 membrane transport protein [Nonomuraea gerenzanensis]